MTKEQSFNASKNVFQTVKQPCPRMYLIKCFCLLVIAATGNGDDSSGGISEGEVCTVFIKGLLLPI